MGIIYRGTHLETGLPVAIKVIDRAAGGALGRRFPEEVQAHAGLLHPGIVYLFEYGLVDRDAAEASEGELPEGSPYVVMEMADHGTVRDTLPRTSWSSVRRILIHVLDALAYAHARQVVHRDLKPENLLVFDDEDARRVKLADFGLAHALDRERKIDTGALESAAGTPRYMAPEQLRGRWRDYGPWTDLYALGCVAWELVCGRPPFDGENLFAYAFQHETADRPPLDPQFPVPDSLESWIHRAMASDPERRFRRAADALWALPGEVPTSSPEREESESASGRASSSSNTGVSSLATTMEMEPFDATRADPAPPETSSAESEADEALERGEPASNRELNADGSDVVPATQPPIPDQWRPDRTETLPAPLVGAGLGLFGLREPPFVDRRREGDEIWEALQRAVEEQTGEIVFLTGEAGTGKSRLAEWMATRAHELGAAQILHASHAPTDGPAAGLRRGIEQVLRTVKMDRGDLYEFLSENLPGRDSDPPGLHEHDVRALTEFLRPTGEADSRVDGPRYRFSHPRQRRALIVRLLERLGESRTLILWLDDVQWGPFALGVLEHLERASDPLPQALVLATLRRDLLADRPRMEERVDTVTSGDNARRLELSPLSRSHQRDLLDGLLPLGEQLADRLAERTEGHPLFAMQLLSHWIDRGVLEMGADGFEIAEEGDFSLPDDIYSLWMERLDRFIEDSPARDAAALEALELAAVLGPEVDRDLWTALFEERLDVEPDQLVSDLSERGLAERTSVGWAFAHGLLVDSIQRRARDAGRLRGHHRRIARHLEEQLPGDESGLPRRVAEHWIAAGRPERALAPLREAAELSTEYGEVEEYRRVLARRRELLDEIEVAETDPRRLRQELMEARRLARSGKLREARGCLVDLWDALGGEPLDLRAETAVLMGQLERDLGDREVARSWMRRALELGRRAGSPYLRSRCTISTAWFELEGGNRERASRLASRAEVFAERAEHRYQRIESLRAQAKARPADGSDGTREALERLRRLAAEEGFLFIEAQALNDLGDRARYAEHFSEARRYYRRYRRRSRELAQPRLIAIADLNRAQVELGAGRLAEAEEILEAAEQRLEEVGFKESRRGLTRLTHLVLAAGEGDRARLDALWEPLTDGWPEEWRLIDDHPWLLKTAADYAERAGWDDAARAIWRLARNLWRQLGEESRAIHVERRLERDDADSDG